MKIFLLNVCTLAIHFLTEAQKPVNNPRVYMQHFSNDSINVYYNEQYYLMQDSCADIVRQVHFNRTPAKFTGLFKDVSKADPTQIVAVGAYDKDGLKQGDFKCWHLNGKLQARGSFKDNNFIDTWDFYYPSGKPKITVEPSGAEIRIVNAWNEDGKKTVENGNGSYELVIGPITWKGKINDGRPNGNWTAARYFFKQYEVLATERFENGLFKQGSNTAGTYTDSSNIHLYAADFLPLIRAEYLIVSPVDCHTRNIESAWYPTGPQQFTSEVAERFTPVLNRLNLGPFSEPIALQGQILKDGRLTIDPLNGTDPQMVSAFKAAIISLPNFKPATVNGKPVAQNIVISINYNATVYSFSYRLLPVNL